MYPVSNAFLDAVKANNRKYYWTGRITTTAGTVYEFDQDDMVKGKGISQASAAAPRRLSWERCMLRRWGYLYSPRLTGTRWKMQRWSCSITCR